ncbi:hypothetical protein A9Q87_04485 [Flavobacteriales bacterium 34_180_T64]|nr:hypothetical protein A9Q87_04485 [Flavobacteriales bacterium 34_180_T64]
MKKNFTIQSILAILMLFCAVSSFSQGRTCGTDQYMEEMLKDPVLAKQHAENQKKFQAEMARRSNGDYSRRGGSVVIPVAVHFPTGSESDRACLVALAQSQVDVLNADYAANNADISQWAAASAFYPGLQPGSANISFCLAISNHPVGIDPELLEGEPAVTIGYNFAGGSGFPEMDANWAGYMNFLVKDIGGGLLGYSPGGGNLTQGMAVVMNLFSFGTGGGCAGSGIAPQAPFNLGRTVTHELGHFYNLQHTWGPAGPSCATDDGFADTPNTGVETYFCPAAGSAPGCVGGESILTMNYMDYVDDACMYMFTPDQMNAVDAYITTIIAPQIKPGVCAPAVPTFNMVAVESELSTCPDTDTQAVFTFNYTTVEGFNETTTFSAVGEPAGTTVAFNPTSRNDDGSFTMTVNGLFGSVLGEYTITVTGTSTSETKSVEVLLKNTCAVIVCDPYPSAMNLGIPIVDGNPGIAASTINIPDSGTIESMTVTVNLDHTWVADLILQLQHPNGVDFMNMWSNDCNGEEGISITFDDTAGAIVCGTSPIAGTFAPSSPLSTFSGLDMNGDWTLIVADFAAGDTGTLNDWSIEICSEQQLSVNDFTSGNFSIFPNPNSGEFTIKLNSNSGNAITVDVHDIRGRRIFNNAFNAASEFEQTIRLNAVQAGMYLVTVNDGERTVTKRIIVE